MAGNTLSFLGQQLLYNVPMLLTCLFGIVMSIAFIGRCRGPALLTLAACLLMLLTAVVTAGAQAMIFERMQNGGGGPGDFSRFFGYIGMVGAWVRAIATGLIIGAVFIDRLRRPEWAPAGDADREWRGG